MEVPYVFEERGRGSSKLGVLQHTEYLLHLGRLARSTGQLAIWTRYAPVGLQGAVINVGSVYALVKCGG